MLRKYLELPNGIPSHDTLSRTFALLDSVIWEALFSSWMIMAKLESAESAESAESLEVGLKHYQLDGKSLLGSESSGTGKVEEAQEALNVVSLWASEERVVLTQTAVATGSNEITAARKLLSGMDLEGVVVSMDAIHAQLETLSLIRQQQGDYVVGLKTNQKQMFNAANDLFEDHQSQSPSPEYSQTFDVAHGREEQRTLYILRDLDQLKLADCRFELWVGLRCIFVLETQVTRQGKTTRKRRFYLSSLDCSTAEALRLVRGHWSIENHQHYILDVTFHEDANRTRHGFAARNLALVRRMVLNLISLFQAKPLNSNLKKLSARRLRLRAARDDAFLLQILGLQTSH